MPMDVVVIRHVRMDMVQRLVSMPMTVGPEGHLVVLMQMVTIVVAMGVLVLKRFVLVRVRMLFGDEKHDTAHHQRRTGQHPDAAAALAEQESQQRSDERGERKYRAGARDTEGSLRQQGVSWYQSQARVAVDCRLEREHRRRARAACMRQPPRQRTGPTPAPKSAISTSRGA